MSKLLTAANLGGRWGRGRGRPATTRTVDLRRAKILWVAISGGSVEPVPCDACSGSSSSATYRFLGRPDRRVCKARSRPHFAHFVVAGNFPRLETGDVNEPKIVPFAALEPRGAPRLRVESRRRLVGCPRPSCSLTQSRVSRKRARAQDTVSRIMSAGFAFRELRPGRC